MFHGTVALGTNVYKFDFFKVSYILKVTKYFCQENNITVLMKTISWVVQCIY